MRVRKQAVLLFVLIGLVFVPQSQARAELPAPDELGPWAVGRSSFNLVDPARDDRETFIDAWYPVDAEDAVGAASVYTLLFANLASAVAFDAPPVSDEEAFPLIVFSHGNGGIRFQSFFLCEILASHGFIVVSPDHTGNTLLEAFFDTSDDTVVAAINRPGDVSFLIDQMLAKNQDALDPFFATVDPERIGVTGHSFGGFTSLAMAAGLPEDIGDQFDVETPEGFEGIPPDPRVRAIVPLAPASTPFDDEALAGIEIPTLILGGTSDTTTPIVPESSRPFELISALPRYRVDIDRAGHFSFTSLCDILDVLKDLGFSDEAIDELAGDAIDMGCAPELIPIEEAKRITNLYTVAFFHRHLNEDRRYGRFLRRGYSRVRERNVQFFAEQALPNLRDWLRFIRALAEARSRLP